MNEVLTNDDHRKRLETLLSYLESDGDNAALRSDAIDTALAANEPEIARRLIGPAPATEPLPDADTNRLGLAYLQERNFAASAETFLSLVEHGCDDPAVIFNLAWSRAMEKDFGSALALLDASVTKAIPQAAMLEVQLLHEAGEFDLAAKRAEGHLVDHPDHQGLAAVVSVLALDVENPELAERCALAAGNHPDALSTLGTLALGRQETNVAIEQFDRALAINNNVPRALVGRGLAKLVSDDSSGAAADIDRGAELFDDHLGSWIAAGWAYLLKGDLKTARERFNKSMSIDHNFAENFGSLAVIDVLDGKLDEAKQGIVTALKLDRQSFSAAMAQSLLTSAQGSPEEGAKIFRQILETPINDRGDTAMMALARMGMS